MWFEPLAELGTLLAGCAAMLGAATPFFKKTMFFEGTPSVRECSKPRRISQTNSCSEVL